MAGGWRAAVLLLLLLLLVTSDSAAGRTPSATPTPSTSTSAPLLATSPPPPSSAPATPATSSGASSSNLSAWKALESGALAPPSSSSSSPPTPSAVSTAHLLGCEPMKLANALFKHCRDAPRPEPIPNARCCGAAVSAVARPTCFCLVQKEVAFIVSAVYNRSTMGKLLDQCGAFPGLRRIVDDPCGDNMDDHGCASPVKASASCRSYKITTIVGWTLVCVLVATVLYTLLWRQAPARRAHG